MVEKVLLHEVTGSRPWMRERLESGMSFLPVDAMSPLMVGVIYLAIAIAAGAGAVLTGR